MKIQSPWMGRVRGSAGNMTGSKVYDKNVMRAKAFEVSNPNTQAQQTERSFFTQLSKLVGTFTDDQLRTLFPAKPKTMSRRNALSKQLSGYNYTFNTEKILDYSAIDTLGNAPVMDFGETTLNVNEGIATIVLDDSVKTNKQFEDNNFIVALVNDNAGEIYLTTNNAKVSVGTVNIVIPSNWDSNDAIFTIPLITDSKVDVSTIGFGSFIIKARPPKAGN